VANYPNSLDSFATNRADGTAMATTHKTDHNEVNDAINKIEAELGVLPKGAYASVRARLDATGSGNKALVYNVVTDYAAPVYTTEAAAAAGTSAVTAIQNAINAANSAGGGTVFFPAGFYRISTTLTSYANVKLVGDGMDHVTLLADDVTGDTLTITATYNVSSNLTANVVFDDRTAAVVSGASFAAGDLVMLSDTTAINDGPSGSNTRWITRIAAISSNTLSFDEHCPALLFASATGGKVQKISTGMLRGVEVKDITFKVVSEGTTENRSSAIHLEGCLDALIERVMVRGYAGQSAGQPIWIKWSRGTHIRNCHFFYIVDAASTLLNNCRTIDVYGSTDTSVIGCSFQKCADAICFNYSPYSLTANNTIGGAAADRGQISPGPLPVAGDTGGRAIKYLWGCNFGRVIGNVIQSQAYDGIRFHDCAYCHADSNTIFHSQDRAIYVLAGDHATKTWNHHNIVSNNQIIYQIGRVVSGTQAFTYCISVSAGDNNSVQNNTIYWARATNNDTGTLGIWVDSGCLNTNISGNVIDQVPGWGILVDSTSGSSIISGNVVKSANIGIKTSTGAGGNVIEANQLLSCTTGYTLHSTDIGYETSGTASTSSSTTVVVTHGLSTTPTRIILTPRGNPGGAWWATALTSTQFTITLAVSGTVTFDWRACLGDKQ
jgi:parallel beta-helix repeat protein